MAKKTPAPPVEDEATENEMPMMPAKKKGKGKMPPPGAAKPAWRKIADAMVKK